MLFDSPKPIVLGGNLEVMAGYYQNLGLVASSKEEVMTILKNEIRDGALRPDDLEIKEVIFDHIDPKIKERSSDPKLFKIWYRSGRSYFEEA